MGRGDPDLAPGRESNNLSLIICTVIGVIVFGAMAYAIFKFRKSKGAVAATFSHNTKAEVIWTVIPVIILIVMAGRPPPT